VGLADDAATHHTALLADEIAIARLHHLRGWTVDALTRLGIGIDGHRVTIPVHDAHGNVVNILRYAPNPARRNGPKVLSEKGAPRHLFPRPEDIDGDYVVLVEGEADAITAHSHGIPAVAIPGTGTRPDVTRLKGHEILVLFDNDDPGQKAAGEWCKALCRVAIVKRGAWPHDGDDLGDVWKRDPEGFRRTFLAVEEAARVVEPPRLNTVSYKDFAAGVGPRDESLDYLGPLFTGGQRTHIIGPIGHGKTTFMAEAVAAAVNGTEFLGFQGRGNLKALYIDLEMPQRLLLATLRAARFDIDDNNFHLAHYPDGLKIDTSAEHREMLENTVADYQIVAIDPWYKLIAEELSEGMRRVRDVISFLDGLRSRNPRTSIVVGFHANEPQRGVKLGGLGDASGYKAFQRPADTALIFERLGASDRSRITWAKARDERLPKLRTEWLVEWSRGEGFVRVEATKATDQVLGFLTDEWQTAFGVAEQWGKGQEYTARVLNELVTRGMAQSEGGSKGGRGRAKRFRVANANQGAIDLAA
jgi:hypothetical protein